MREATQADLAVRRTGSDDQWMPIQVKSCSIGKGKFNIGKNYANMILALVELNAVNGGELWIGRRDDFPATGVRNIRANKYCGGKTLSYETYRVLDAHNLNARLHSFDTDPYIIKRPLDYLNVPSGSMRRKELLSQILFRSVLASHGHTMTPPKYENTATDWFLTGSISVQDKTVGFQHSLQYQVAFHKSNGVVNGKAKIQPYAEGDNQVYLIYVLDQEYKKADFEGSFDDFMELTKTASLRGCYMFREADLIATGHIATATQPGKINSRVPVPNADGTFEAKRTYGGAKRMHNFQRNYFHKTNFKNMIDSMIEK